MSEGSEKDPKNATENATALPPETYVKIDEEGYFQIDDLRVADVESARRWQRDLHLDRDRRLLTKINGAPTIVEAFDDPIVARDIEPLASSPVDGATWMLHTTYQNQFTFKLQSLVVDEWDRFHGRTESGVSFVFSRAAQARFFDLVDSFDDEGFTVGSQFYQTLPWLQPLNDANRPEWWSELYAKDEARWDLNAPSPALAAFVPQLKLYRSRILLVGAGRAHDAAWLAEQGHIVTAVDFSAEAVSRAQAKYPGVANLRFVQADAFRLPSEMDRQFDVVFEHTFYCAVSPERRGDVVRAWRRALVDGGHLIGVFFVFDKPYGPPFGGSEWELRSRFNENFRPLYWNRMRNSVPRRLGNELFVFAEKLAKL